MAAFVIYHNPKCSKSRETLALLREAGIEPQIVDYLKDRPDAETLHGLVQKLGVKPREIVRTKEETFKSLARDLDLDDGEAVLVAIATHPVLLERPIVVHGNKAVIGRPPENVKALF